MKELENKNRRERLRDYFLANRESVLRQHREWRANNPEKARTTARKWRERNREKIIKYNQKYTSLNKDKILESKRKWLDKNPEKMRQITANWRKDNIHKSRSNVQRRRALRNSMIHEGMDYAAERDLFLKAQQLTIETGEIHHVDHIIPISCGGWHHHLNLQVLSCTLNLRKSDDPFWEMAGYKSWRDVPRFLWPERLRPSYEAMSTSS